MCRKHYENDLGKAFQGGNANQRTLSQNRPAQREADHSNDDDERDSEGEDARDEGSHDIQEDEDTAEKKQERERQNAIFLAAFGGVPGSSEGLAVRGRDLLRTLDQAQVR